MPYLRENPTDTSDPGTVSGRQARADRMLQAIEAGVEVARSIADGALEAGGDDQARYDSLYRILWTLDRVSEGLTAASEFVQAHWAKPETSTS